MTPSPRYYRKVHGENPRYYCGYRGITAVPITVQLSTLDTIVTLAIQVGFSLALRSVVRNIFGFHHKRQYLHF